MVTIKLSDWLYNAGVLGLYRMLRHQQLPVQLTQGGISFKEEVLEDFGEIYFEYLKDRYEKATSWYGIVDTRYFIEDLKKENLTKEKLETFNKKIESIKNKCKSASYKSAFSLVPNISFDAEEVSKELKKITLKKNQQIEEIWEDVQSTKEQYLEILDYLEQQEVKKYVLGKNMMYDVVQLFWENVSFLHKQQSKEDMYKVATEDFTQAIKSYMQKDHSKDKYKCMQCNRGIAKLSKPDAYDLAWLKRMGVDMGRKSSHFWNYSVDANICPICYIVYACVPLGFTIVKGQGLFINDNSSIERLDSLNAKSIGAGMSLDEIEQKNYYQLADFIKDEEAKKAQKQVNNIQIIRYDSQNDSRPYTFNMLSKEKLQALTGIKKQLSGLLKIKIAVVDMPKKSEDFINVYYEVIQNIYDNKNQFELIAKLTYLLIKGKTKRVNKIIDILIINHYFNGGGGKMVGYNQIEQCRDKGIELRKAYIGKGAENKIVGMSHKLLNALKVKNASKFMDILLQAYMYVGDGIPKVFLEALKSEEKLQTLGYAFLLGLQSEKRVKENGEGKENE